MRLGSAKILIGVILGLWLVSCAGGAGRGSSGGSSSSGSRSGRSSRVDSDRDTGGPKVDLTGVKGDVELLEPKEIKTGEILLPIDHSARIKVTDKYRATDKHRAAFEKLSADLIAAGFQERSLTQLEKVFPVGKAKVGGEGVRDLFLIGTFRQSSPFVTHLRHAAGEKRSRFTASVIWTTEKSGAETAQQRDKVGDFCEDLGIWWARHDPFR